MEAISQIVALAMVGACLSLLLRGQSGALAILVPMIACVLIMLFSVRFLAPFLELIETIRDMTGLADALTAPMIKVAGIGMLTQLAGSVCEDAGEKALSKAVEIGGTILSLYTALPVLLAVVRMMEQTLGEHG